MSGLTTAALQNIIASFDEDALKESGTFGIHEYGGGSDESYIRANKEGLELFALQLLKVAATISATEKDKLPNKLDIALHEDWFDEDSTTFLSYITMVDKKERVQGNSSDSIIVKMMGYGIMLLLIFLGAALLIGIETIFGWFF